MPNTEVFYSQTSWSLKGWLESENAWWLPDLWSFKGGRGHGKGECPHSLCQLNEKEMKASVLMTEFGSEEAIGRIREQGYDRVLKTQWDWEMGRVYVAWWNGFWTGKRKTGKEDLSSNLKSTTNRLCVYGEVSKRFGVRCCILWLVRKQHSRVVKAGFGVNRVVPLPTWVIWVNYFSLWTSVFISVKWRSWRPGLS